MFNFIFRRWLIGKKIREYEKQALAHEFESSEIYLDIRNNKGLIDAENEDIKANSDDIKQDEFEIEKARKATDAELFEWYIDEQLEDGKDPKDLPTELNPQLILDLRKDNNEYIVQLQTEIKNLKASNESAGQRIKEREIELRGMLDQNGKVLKQGHNTRYQGHMAAAKKARIHADELKKFLRKTHANKIKLADEKTDTAD